VTDYTDLIARLRLSQTGGIHYEAADALEAQARRISELEVPLCVGETTIRLLAKEGACDWTDGRALVAADELFRQDPYARIAELEKMLAVHRLAVDVDALKARIAELEAENEELKKAISKPWMGSARAAYLGEKE
jgi:hypothetical protein